MEDNGNQISKYNDAGLSVSRLHDIWLRCRVFKNRGSFSAWREQLVDAWLELYPDVLRKEDKKEIVLEYKDLMGKVTLSKDRRKLYFNLIELQQFLRGLQDNAGKGGVYIDANEEGFI